MTMISRNVAVAVSFALLAVAGTLMSSRPAGAGPNKVDAVQIVSPLPLPVTADIVSSVPLQVSVPPSAPAVPFQQPVFVTINANTTGSQASVDVPPGKRLVVESVAGAVFLPAGQLLRGAHLRTDLSAAPFALVGSPVAGQTHSVAGINHALKLYADQKVEFS